MSILVIDVGTSSLRAAIVQPDATVAHVHQQRLPPSTPFPGLVEFDATEMADAVARRGPRHAGRGRPGRCGRHHQPAGLDRACGTAPPASPSAPAIGWQDLRTVFDCLTLAGEHGIRLAPNQSATKLAAPARTRTTRTAARPVLRHGRHVAGVDAVGRPAPRHRPQQRRGHRPARPRSTCSGRTTCSRPCAIPRSMLPTLVDSSGAHRRGLRARRGTADRRARRRPAGLAHRAGLRAPRPHQDHLRHRRDARHLHRVGRAGERPAQPPRHVPHRGLVHRGRADLGRRGDHAVGRHQRRVAGRRPRHPGDAGGEPRAWPARAPTPVASSTCPPLLGLGTPAVGLRRPRHPARPHPRDRPARAGASGAGGRRPAGRRPGRGGRGRHRAGASRCCGSTAG